MRSAAHESIVMGGGGAGDGTGVESEVPVDQPVEVSRRELAVWSGAEGLGRAWKS